MHKKLKANFDEAEKKARQLDQLVEKENHIDLNAVNQIENQANNLGYGLYKKRDVNKANFTQTINSNLDFLIRINYLTSSELAFLLSITPLIELHVNAIADKNTGQFVTVSGIARHLKRSRSRVSNIISSLKKKGILFEFVNVDEILEFQRNVTARSLFVNPEILYAGDRNRIDGTLAMLVTKYDKLERNNILLDWKIWKKAGEQYGRLYRRKTYLKIKDKV